MSEVLQIEQESFNYAWTEEYFLRCSRQRNCVSMVATQGAKVAGFMIYELYKAKLHIVNFAVHPECRRRGVASCMTSKLISKLSKNWRTRIVLELQETNLPAQLFFRAQGFKAVRVIRKFYEDTGEDAYSMQYRIEGTEENTEDRLVLTNRISKYF